MELSKNVYYVGVKDKELKIFDIIMETKFGTTYNAYLIKGSENSCLIETAKVNFFEEYLNNVNSVEDIKKIKYLIVNHTEPDHVGSVEKILDLNPELIIVGSQMAINFLKNITNREFNNQVVKDGDELSLGDKHLKFISAVNLHWPDTMYTYLKEDEILFTCDSFGAHYSFDGIKLSEVKNTDDYLEARQFYFDNILGPFKPFMIKAMNAIKDLPIKMICNGHGPIIDCNFEELFDTYQKWCTPIINNPKLVVVAYVSSYQYTKMMAEEIVKGLKDSGVKVEVYNMLEHSKEEISSRINVCDGVLLGSPTILQDALEPIWDLVATMHPATHSQKYASAFGSYGWSGEAVGMLVDRMKAIRMKTVDGLKIPFKPSEAQLKQCYDFGKAFGEGIK